MEKEKFVSLRNEVKIDSYWPRSNLLRKRLKSCEKFYAENNFPN